MKLFLILLTTITACLASADSFTVIRDGKNYLCQEQPTGSPGGAVDCSNKAYQGPFSRDEAMRLCAGAINTAPADCGIKAYQGPFSKEEALRLCTRARTIGPADCGIKAYQGPFSKEESLTLCQGDSSVANADCAIKAYQGPYSKEESIRMCKNQPMLVMRGLDLIAKSQELKPKVEAIKAQIQQNENLKK